MRKYVRWQHNELDKNKVFHHYLPYDKSVEQLKQNVFVHAPVEQGNSSSSTEHSLS
jgi:hypothetical protein